MSIPSNAPCNPPEEKGNARFDVEKETLGLRINGVDCTVRLSEAKVEGLVN